MKRSQWILSAVVATAGSLSALTPAYAVPAVRSPGSEVSVNISTAVLPSGYDPSEPLAIISGMFSNSCYRCNRASVSNVTETLHEVRAIANVQMGMCLMVLIPFSEEVHFGKLSRGTHTLRFMNGDGTYQEKQVVVDQ